MVPGRRPVLLGLPATAAGLLLSRFRDLLPDLRRLPAPEDRSGRSGLAGPAVAGVLARSLLPGRVDPGWHFQVFLVIYDGLVVGLLVGVGILALEVVAPVAADLVFAALEVVVARFVTVAAYTAVPDTLEESECRDCGWALPDFY